LSQDKVAKSLDLDRSQLLRRLVRQQIGKHSKATTVAVAAFTAGPNTTLPPLWRPRPYN
jgi:hypothetical protein